MPQPAGCGDTMYSVMMYCWEMLAEDRPTFAYLRDNLEKLKGGESVVIGPNGAAEAEPEEEQPPEPPARRRSQPDAAGGEWRQQFEQKSDLAASSDLDLQEVMEKIREAFGLAQRIVRYVPPLGGVLHTRTPQPLVVLLSSWSLRCTVDVCGPSRWLRDSPEGPGAWRLCAVSSPLIPPALVFYSGCARTMTCTA